jgi:hypothetical protein
MLVLCFDVSGGLCGGVDLGIDVGIGVSGVGGYDYAWWRSRISYQA